MKTRVQKWGNSLALRIPTSFAAEAGFCANDDVELSLVEGALVVKAVKPRTLTLAELLRDVTNENIPGEWDTGPAVGKEFGLAGAKAARIGAVPEEIVAYISVRDYAVKGL